MSTDVLTPQGAVAGDCSNRDYHSDGKNSLSHSEKECFLQSPALYYGRIITGEYARETTDALTFGSFLHERELEGRSQFPVWRGGTRRGKEWDAFEAANPVSITEKEMAVMDAMHEQIQGHAIARKLLALPGGINERAIWWDEPLTAHRLRCRPDRFVPRVAIIDIKTTRSAQPRQFASSVEEYGYHRQAAWYQDGVFALTGQLLPFVFIAIEKDPPYTCNVFQLDDEWVMRGRGENQTAIARMIECFETGNWRGPQEILTIKPPHWANKADMWSAE